MFVLYSCMATSNKEFGVCVYYNHVWRCPIKRVWGMCVLYSCMAMSNKESLRYVGIIFMYGDVQ